MRFEILLRTDIAVVLVDVVMPEMDGYDLAGLIRQHPRFATRPSSWSRASRCPTSDRLKGYDSGAVDYVRPDRPGDAARRCVYVDLFRKTRASCTG